MGSKMINTFRLLNRSVLRVAEEAVRLNTYEPNKVKFNQVRLKEDLPIITMTAVKTNNFVTAHVLDEYRNRIANIQLKEDVGSMLDKLMEF